MRKKLGIAVVTALLASPFAAQAQGIFGGMERGAAEGSAAGPVGGIVGGAGDGVKGCSASTQGHATIAIGCMSTGQLIAITGTIAIITDGPARARQCSHTGLPLLFMAGSGPAPEGLRKGEAGWPVALAGRTRFARECAASSRL